MIQEQMLLNMITGKNEECKRIQAVVADNVEWIIVRHNKYYPKKETNKLHRLFEYY